MKRFLIALLIGVMLVTPPTYVHAEDLQLYARSAVLMDADSGRILFAKNGQEILPMASTTKIMTCILALEYADFDDEITFSAEAVSQPKVHLGANEGETFLLRDLLYSLMLESHNDTAVAIAEGISGSVQKFTQLMNTKAKEIGCEHTHFVTPNGLDASDQSGIHATTAEGLARIMKYCIYDSDKKEEFLVITRQKSYSFSNIEETRQYSCNNHNAFLQMMDGALSGKTGFTGDAGYCYVGALKRDDRTFVVALLACGWPNHKGYKWSDTQKLMNYGLENYQYEKIELKKLNSIVVKEGIPIQPAECENEGTITKDRKYYRDAEIDLEYQDNMNRDKILISNREELETDIELENSLLAPVKKGQSVGTIKYRIGDATVFESEIITKYDVERVNYMWFLTIIFKKYTEMLK